MSTAGFCTGGHGAHHHHAAHQQGVGIAAVFFRVLGQANGAALAADVFIFHLVCRAHSLEGGAQRTARLVPAAARVGGNDDAQRARHLGRLGGRRGCAGGSGLRQAAGASGSTWRPKRRCGRGSVCVACEKTLVRVGCECRAGRHQHESWVGRARCAAFCLPTMTAQALARSCGGRTERLDVFVVPVILTCKTVNWLSRGLGYPLN